MRKLIVTAAFALLAFPSFGALQYEFVQKNTTEDAISPVTDLTARATIDGVRSRIDFLSGSLYPAGTYVVSTDGARNLRFVDPVHKSFTEVNTASVATRIASSNIKIANQKVEFQEFPERTTMLGVQAKHYRVTMSYDITVSVRATPVTQHVRTDIETWTTDQYAYARDVFTTSAARTGDPDVDALLEAETAKITGLPLRQVVTIRTSYERARGSKLDSPTNRTITRQMWVTSIRETQADAADFLVPPTFRRAEQPDVPKWAPQVLTFEPASK